MRVRVLHHRFPVVCREHQCRQIVQQGRSVVNLCQPQPRRALGAVECRCRLVVSMWVWTCQTRVMVLVV